MKRRILSIITALALCLSMFPAAALAVEGGAQLTEGGTYYFDLSGAGIPGNKVNSSLPGGSLSWVPFTYVGEVNAYVLKESSTNNTEAIAEAAAATDPTAQYGYTYPHSLFIADRYVKSGLNWSNTDLNPGGVIFGKTYASGGVSYTLRAPSTGMGTGSGACEPGNNEWDVILNQSEDYIKNWSEAGFWGQEVYKETGGIISVLGCHARGKNSIRGSSHMAIPNTTDAAGFRPVLELPAGLTAGDLSVVTVDLNGGSLDAKASVDLAVKSGSGFTAPGSTGVAAPEIPGETMTFEGWTDGGNTYQPGDAIPAGVTKLTAKWSIAPRCSIAADQTSLNFGSVYPDYSAADMRKTVTVTNTGNQPVTLELSTAQTFSVSELSKAELAPNETASFTVQPPAGLRAGSYSDTVTVKGASGDQRTNEVTITSSFTVQAYSSASALNTGGTYYFDLSGAGIPGSRNWVAFTYAGQISAYSGTNYSSYDHCLFIAENSVVNETWNNLDGKGLIYGKTYASGGVNYTLRAPSGGTGSAAVGGGTPTNNEWDVIRGKNFIKNDSFRSLAQDLIGEAGTARTYSVVRQGEQFELVSPTYLFSFRPVLELSRGLLDSDLRSPALYLNGGSLDGREKADIVVKSGEAFPAPGAEGLTAPSGKELSGWKDSDGVTYNAGDSVPGTVEYLVAQWRSVYYTVTVQAGENGSVSGGGRFEANTSVTVTAAPDEGYQFLRWEEDGKTVSTEESYTFQVTGDRTLTAVFEHVHAWGNWTPDGDGAHHSRVCETNGNHRETELCAYTFSGATGTCAACGDSVTVAVSGAENLIYDGTGKKPGVTVMRGTTELAAGDYSVTYTDNTNAGTAKVTVTIGNNQGTYNGSFNIGKASLTIKASDQTITYGQSIDERAATAPGLCPGDTLESVTLTPDAEDVPGGSITPSAAVILNAAQENVTGNYDIVYQDGTLTINKDTSATPPDVGEGYTLDYAQETITVEEGYEVSTAQDGGAAVPSGSITDHLGQTLYIRKVEDDNHAASGWTAFTLAARPAAPSLTKTDETLKGKADGQLTGDASGTEYSTDGGTTWKDYADGAFTGLAGGTTVQVRVKAAEAAPHGEVSSYSIAEGKTITVTFDSQGGSAVAAQSGLSYEATVTRPDPPTRTDYEFLGWYTAADGTTEWNFETNKVTAENVTIYAKWKQVNFSIGGTVTDDGRNVVEGATVTLMQGSRQIDQGITGSDGAFTFSQHIPAGAYNIVTTSGEQTKTTLITIADSDMNDVAVQLPPKGVSSHLTVSANSNTPAVVVGGLDEEAAALKTENTNASTVTVSMTVEGKEESAVPAKEVTAIKEAAGTSGASDPTVEYLDVSITKQVDDTKEPVTSTTNVIEIVVPFDFSGKNNIAVLRYHGSSAASLTRLNSKPTSGYTDGTFYLDTANGFLYIYATQFSTYAVAYTETNYTITFDANGGTVGTASAKTNPDGTLSTLPTPSRSGYSFTGWYTAASGGTQVTTATVFTKNTTIYAHWQQNTPVDPTIPVTGISLDKSGLTLTTGQTEQLTATVRPSNATNKSVVWSTSDLSVAAVDSSGNVTARAPGTAVITVTTRSGSHKATCAVTVVSVSYTVTYAPNGGTGTMADGIAPDGEPFVLPECGFTAPEGKAFAGWSIGGTIVAAGGSYTFTSDTTVLAVWKDAEAVTYRVTFLPNGGTGTAPTMADTAEGGMFQLPANPFHSPGYQFSGWSYGGIVYQPGDTFTMPDHDVTFSAQWNPIIYAITGRVLQKGVSVPGVTVRLMLGSTEIARCVTGEGGRFAFEDVPSGIYNLVAEKDGVTKTVMQEIVSSGAETTIELPLGKTNSVVEIKDKDTPPVIVGGLDDLFKDDTLYTAEDKAIVAAGGTVEFKMEVGKRDTLPEGTVIEALKPSGQIWGLFLDMSITKTVTRVDGTEASSPVTEVGHLITVRIPLPVELQGKDHYAVYRVHGGTAEVLPNSGSGERYEVDPDKAVVTIYAQKYSTYAIAWNNETPPLTPSWPTAPSGGGTSVKTYAITVEKSEHGTVTASRTNAASGTTVTLTVTPDAGYVLLDLAVTDSQGNQINLTDKNTFTMPPRAVTVTATFAPLPDENQEQPCDGGVDCPSRSFTDLGTVGTWYHEAVDYVLRNGLMNGHDNGLFGPDDGLTRAQLAQILHNLKGRPAVNYLLQFEDVPSGAWYTEAVRWAASTGIVGGYGNGLFGPDDKITREQLAVMLWRYAGSPAATEKELHFSDANQASSWAAEALRWAIENGIINGKGGGILDPAGPATRAEAAEMLKNFLENQ